MNKQRNGFLGISILALAAELEKLKVSRDTENATFTVLEGDMEKIIALCREHG